MIMMMAYYAHLLHRIFAVESRLGYGQGSFKCLEQLRQALNSEGSFAASLGDLARGSGFHFTHALFASAAPVLPMAPLDSGAELALAAVPYAVVDLGSLQDGSRNVTKLGFLNSAAGIELRRDSRTLHIADYATKRHCLLCDLTTTAYCKQCSHNASNVVFPVCTTASKSNGRRNVFSCMEIMHNRDDLRFDDTRTKITSDAQAASLHTRTAARAKRKHDDAVDQPLTLPLLPLDIGGSFAAELAGAE